MISTDTLSTVLRSAGEPSRLRMLALCATQRVAVSEFAGVLGHSEPSISRHLKLLEDAGLVSRARQGQRVYFRVHGELANAAAAQALLSQLDVREPVLVRDRQRLLALRSMADGPAVVATESRLGRALALLAKTELQLSLAPQIAFVGRLRHVQILEPLLAAATLVQLSVRDAAERDALRRWVAEREIQGGSRLQFAENSASRDRRQYDLVVVDCSVDSRDIVERELNSAAARLGPQGRLWLLAGYEALEAGDRAEHPLLLVRRLMLAAGLNCERLQPVEADGSHILFSVGQRVAKLRQATG